MLGALWLCAAFTSTASGGIPVSSCTISRVAAVSSAPAKTRSVATIAIALEPSSSTSACAIIGSWTPSARPVRSLQAPGGSPHGGVMSTRATPAVNVVIGLLLYSFAVSQSSRQLVVGLGASLLERVPRVLARALERLGVELDRDPRVLRRELRASQASTRPAQARRRRRRGCCARRSRPCRRTPRRRRCRGRGSRGAGAGTAVARAAPPGRAGSSRRARGSRARRT